MKAVEKRSYYKAFYKTLEGHYNSYWTSKLINSFMKKGQLIVVEKEFEKVYKHAKIHLKISPVLVLLETIEKIKPIFKLKSVMQRGKKKDFPIFLDKYKQRLIAVKNFRNLVDARKEWYLSQRLLNELSDLISIKNHELIKQRDEQLKLAAKNRFNARFKQRKF